jgi:O-antigen ligase
LLLTLLNTLFIHILSARTGLLALYTGIAVLLFQAASSIPRRYKLYFFASLIAGPTLLFMFSSSLRNRMSNSMSDLQVVWSGKDANDYSFAMRVEAWKNAADLIKRHPITGVGTGDADKELHENFAVFNPNIQENNRKNPHMQVLETAVQSGLLSALLYLGIFAFIFFGKSRMNTPAAAMAMLLFIASCFESILERQASVVGFSVLIALALCLKVANAQTKTPES